jgi:LmbE family N-acetylglucosaminyl deacetylase
MEEHGRMALSKGWGFVARRADENGHRWVHALRAALARRFLLKIKRASHRAAPQLVIPQARRAVVIAPHADDEVIPCAGTLILLGEGGAEVHVVYVSDSSTGCKNREVASSMARTRGAEAIEVAEFLGFTSATCLGFPDGQLFKNERSIADALSRCIEQIGPDLIFCPFPGDAHSDHMSCAWATAAATKRTSWSGSIWAYEVWTPLWPNVVVDITRVADRKDEAIRLYRSQVDDRDYAAAALGLNRFRGLAHGVNYAEAFFRGTPADFGRLTRMLDEI